MGCAVPADPAGICPTSAWAGGISGPAIRPGLRGLAGPAAPRTGRRCRGCSPAFLHRGFPGPGLGACRPGFVRRPRLIFAGAPVRAGRRAACVAPGEAWLLDAQVVPPRCNDAQSCYVRDKPEGSSSLGFLGLRTGLRVFHLGSPRSAPKRTHFGFSFGPGKETPALRDNVFPVIAGSNQPPVIASDLIRTLLAIYLEPVHDHPPGAIGRLPRSSSAGT
jgi:hypothetical protein